MLALARPARLVGLTGGVAPHFHRMEEDALHFLVVHLQLNDGRAPPCVRRRIESRMEWMGSRREHRQAVHVVPPGVVAVVGHALDEFRLGEEVSETVEDWLAVVDLDAERAMPTVPNIDIRAAVDGSTSELLDEFRRRVAARTVRDAEVMCDDDEIRHRTRLVDGAQVTIEIPLMAAADDLAAIADEEGVGIAPLLSAGDLNTEGAFPAMLRRFRDVELLREILEVSSCLLIDHEFEVQAKRVDAGPAASAPFG